MDATNITKVVTSNIFWPNGLTIDYPTKRIYWIDAHNDRIETTDYEGNVMLVAEKKSLTTKVNQFNGHRIEFYLYLASTVMQGILQIKIRYNWDSMGHAINLVFFSFWWSIRFFFYKYVVYPIYNCLMRTFIFIKSHSGLFYRPAV